MPSLNGLVDINADSVNSTRVESEEINSKNVDTLTLFVDGLNLGQQVNINAQKLTAISYSAPTTSVTSNLDITGNVILRDTVDPSNNSMTVHYDAPYFGTRFLNNKNGAYIYFSVKDPAGNLKTFQFNHSQTYNNTKFYQDNVFNIGYGLPLYFGDSNGSGQGYYQKYVVSTNAWDGFLHVNQGVPGSGLVFYTNFANADGAGNITQTLRMKYNQMWSLVPHTFNSSATFGSTLDVTGNSNFTGLLTSFGGIKVNANAHFMTMDCSSNAIFNGATAFNSTSNFVGAITANSATFNNSVQFNNSINCGYISGSSMLLTGSIDAGAITLAADVTAYGNAHFTGNYNTFGASQFNGLITASANITCDHNIIQTSGIVTNNKITQTRIYLDTVGNPNILKYTQIRYNSGSNTGNPALQLVDDNGGLAMNFIPNSSSGSYNQIVQTSDRVILASIGTGAPSALVLSSYGPTVKHGIRTYHTSFTNATTDIIEDKYTLNLNSTSALTLSTTDVSGNTSLFNISSSGNRGLTFYPNSVSNTSNVFVTGSEAVISTQTQNNSSLVLTTSNSALSYGIRLLSNSSTTASIRTEVNGNSIVTNQTNHTITGPVTISGPITLANNLTFPDASVQTSAFNSTNLGYTKSGNTLTFPTGTILDVTSGGSVLNEIKTHHFNCYGKVEYADGSMQYTAYSASLNTKLTAIGTTYTATLSATTLLVNNTFFNCGSITLDAGTYTLTMNCGLVIVTGATTIGQILLAPSTSSTALSSNTNLNIDNKNGSSYGVGVQFVLPNQAIVSPTTTTTYYMLIQVAFGTANRIQFSNGTSSFSAVKIA